MTTKHTKRAKNRARKETKRAQKRTLRKKTHLLTKEIVSQEDHVFWIAHGINFIHSDLDQGIWDPLYPEIYQGTLPTPETIHARVSKVSESLTLEHKELIYSWMVRTRKEITKVIWEAQRRFIGDGGLGVTQIKEPKNIWAWSLVDEVSKEVIGDKGRR